MINELIEKEKEAIRLTYENIIAELQRENDTGAVGDMKWLESRLGMSRPNIESRILFPFRGELEGDIVAYPSKAGRKWRVNKKKFNDWIMENFARIEW